MTERFHRTFAISLISAIVLIGANVYSFSLTSDYLPIVFNHYGATSSPSPSPSTPTPTATVPSPPVPSSFVEIKDIFFSGAGMSEPNEYVLIENEDSVPIPLKNWTLRDQKDHMYTFPSFVIQPNQQCRVYTNQNHPDWCGFNYGSASAIWNDTGDTAYLRDSSGTLIDDYRY